jgi:hypothetical protein
VAAAAEGAATAAHEILAARVGRRMEETAPAGPALGAAGLGRWRSMEWGLEVAAAMVELGWKRVLGGLVRRTG